jgi:hypothetical protein
MALLFPGAKNYSIGERDLSGMARQFRRRDPETSRSVLRKYRSRKNPAAEQEQRRLPCFTPRVDSRRRP